MRIQPILATGAFASLLAVVSIQCLPFAFDDAYIHFRIAENFVEYGAPYFNTSDAVMATSSPVWTCVLALLSMAPIALPLLTAILNSLLTAIGSLVWSSVLQQVVEKEVSSLALWLFRLVYVGVMLPSSVGLVETPLALLLFGWSALLLIRGSSFAWSLITLAVFTRYELMVFALLTAAMQLATTRANVLRSVLLGLIPLAILSSFLVFYFSSPIPHTVTAKRIVYSLSSTQVLREVFYNLIPKHDHPVLGLSMAWPLQMFASTLLAWVGMVGVFLLAAVVCCTLPFSRMLSDNRQRWGLCIGVTGVLIGLAYIVKHVFLHEWYVPLFVIPILLFAFAVSSRNYLAYIAAGTLALLPLATLVE